MTRKGLMHAYRRVNVVLLVGILFSLLSWAGLVNAQQTITLLQPVEGELSADRPAQSWAFSTGTNTLVSVFVEATTESLDPTVAILDSGGNEVIFNDDAAYPNVLNALVEAITLPRPGQYQIVVGGFNGTLGTYRLTISPGYATNAVNDSFAEADAWEAVDNVGGVQSGGGQLEMSVQGINLRSMARPVQGDAFTDYYAQVRVVAVRSRNPWYVGLTLRQVNDQYYALEIDSRGQWRFGTWDGADGTILRDWTTHPAITPGQTSFTLGAIAYRNGFSLFYNGLLLGRLRDETLTQPGFIGLLAATENAISSEVAVQFDDLIVTTPFAADGMTAFPSQLVQGDDTITVYELERRGVIPAGAQRIFAVEESFVENAIQGIAQTGLGRGVRFQSLVMATEVTLIPGGGSGAAGCGLVFASQDDQNYAVVYLDTTGAVGISQRAGERFVPGFYRENTGFSALSSNQLLVVVLEDRVHVYVNGAHVGTLEQAFEEGTVGNVLINFDPADTSCEFQDTWLWQMN